MKRKNKLFPVLCNVASKYAFTSSDFPTLFCLCSSSPSCPECVSVYLWRCVSKNAGVAGEWWGVRTLIKMLQLTALEADRGNEQSALTSHLLHFPPSRQTPGSNQETAVVLTLSPVSFWSKGLRCCSWVMTSVSAPISSLSSFSSSSASWSEGCASSAREYR